jgi:predicted DNA-binding transcriptional regulator YafY
MKINRLLEIIILLLNKGTVTAGEFSDRFQVSVRTIYRDIDILSTAGVPVVMARGNKGGISLLEEYSLSKVIISEEEREGLLLALQTLQATRYPQSDLILDKLGAIFKEPSKRDWIEIDFSYWSTPPNEKNKFNDIREAIWLRKVISFDYVNADGQKSSRSAEPEKLLYKGNTWYLIAYCRKREEHRIFRLTRVKNVTLLEETFLPRLCPAREDAACVSPACVYLKLKFQPKILNRIYDDFAEELITKNEDGTLVVEVDFPEDEWVYGYILSYGSYVEVLEPDHIRQIVAGRLRQALKKI